MNAQWVVILLGATGIVAQAVAAFIVVKVATSVLEERLNGHKQLTDEKFKAHEDRLGVHDREIQRLRDWRHDEVAPVLQAHEGRIAALEQEGS